MAVVELDGRMLLIDVGLSFPNADMPGVDLVLPDFEVYCGDDWAAFGYTCLGGVGVISVASHLVASRIGQMIALIANGDVPTARKIHQELSPLFNTLFITSNPIPVKTAMGMLGHDVGGFRLPMVEASQEEAEEIRAVLDRRGLLSAV